MRRPTLLRLPWFLWTLTIIGTVVGSVATALSSGLGYDDLAFAVGFVVFATVGAVIATREPANSIGWIFCSVGALGGLGGFLDAYREVAVHSGLPAADLAAWIGSWLWAPIVGLAYIPLLLLFPDGRPPSRRWRWVLWTAGGFVLFAVLGNGLYPWPESEGGPNPYAIEGAEQALTVLTDMAGAFLIVGIVASVSSLVVRYRRGSALQRQQLRWFITSAALLPMAVVIGELAHQALQAYTAAGALSLFALATGIAILRYRLYDIDRIINRTLVYGALTAILGLVYVGSVVVLGGLLRPVTGSNDLAVAGSTLAVAALFSPLRRRVQGFVDRRFYRSRYDAARTVEAFSTRLRDQVDLDTLRSDLAGVVRETLQPPLGVGVAARRVAMRVRKSVVLVLVVLTGLLPGGSPHRSPSPRDDLVLDLRRVAGETLQPRSTSVWMIGVGR
ncbi:hypothetical protein BH24ACT7_BH24ACT7_15810 [soil metagenome]